MTNLPPRDLETEIAKHFEGTAEERMLLALELGRRTLEVFLATLPSETSAREARRILQRNKNRARRASAVAGTTGRADGR